MKGRITCTVMLAVSLLLSSCGSRENTGRVLDEQQMARVLFDMLQADAFSENFLYRDSLNKPQLTAALQQQIFQLHQVKQEDFRLSYRYYSSRPRQMSRILDSLLARSERSRSNMMMERYSGSKATVEAAGE